ncbi:RING finger protein unkempt, partial [Sarcoptes scabiei]
CPYLHRTAGDTERRYHLRYYKTGMCVYDTDARGYCVKNGAHCAFAHGSHDLRMAVFDVREQIQINGNQIPNGPGDGPGSETLNIDHQTANGQSRGGPDSTQTHSSNNGCSSSLNHMFDKDRNAIHDDSRWQNTAFVLAYYKTELCKRPPRLCRQGYACPQYHNSKDRRRSPKKFKYRSTPCPNVKQGDEWGDPANCENQDDCTYCHTRTEQQFHPEIYKSTKCNDVQQSGHCPRGPFCAFGHSESNEEIAAAREFSLDPTTEIPASIASKTSLNNAITLPMDINRANSYLRSNNQNVGMMIASSLPENCEFGNIDLNLSQQIGQTEIANHHHLSNNVGPIARPRSYSTSTTKTMMMSNWLDKNNLLSKQRANLATGLNNPSLQQANLFPAASSNSLLTNVCHSAENATQNGPGPMPFKTPIFDQVASNNPTVINTIINQQTDLNQEDLDNLIASKNANPSVIDPQTSNLDSSIANASSMNMFDTLLRRGPLYNESEPVNILHPTVGDRTASASGYNLSPPNPMNPAGASPIRSYLGVRTQQSQPQSQQSSNGLHYGNLGTMANNGPTNGQQANLNQDFMPVIKEMRRLTEENTVAKYQVVEIKEKAQQVINICQQQLTEAQKKERMAENALDEALSRLNVAQKELEFLKTSEAIPFQKRVNDLTSLPSNHLMLLREKLSQDISIIDEALKYKSEMNQND